MPISHALHLLVLQPIEKQAMHLLSSIAHTTFASHKN